MWVKGQSGNPKGRIPRERSLTKYLIEATDKLAKGDNVITVKQQLADKLISLALTGDIKALQYVYDRIDGKPKQSVDLGVVDGPLGFAVGFDESETPKEV